MRTVAWLGAMYLNQPADWILYLMTAIALIFGAHLVMAIVAAPTCRLSSRC